MKLKSLLVIASLFAIAPALAQQGIVQLAHEVKLTDLRVPQSEAGTIAFKPCDECEYQTERVTAATRWALNGRSVSLEDFRLGLSRIAERNEVFVTVLHHLEEDRITEVSVYLP